MVGEVDSEAGACFPAGEGEAGCGDVFVILTCAGLKSGEMGFFAAAERSMIFVIYSKGWMDIVDSDNNKGPLNSP